MSNLEELIERLCPDGVEYKKIGELGIAGGIEPRIVVVNTSQPSQYNLISRKRGCYFFKAFSMVVINRSFIIPFS